MIHAFRCLGNPDSPKNDEAKIYGNKIYVKTIVPRILGGTSHLDSGGSNSLIWSNRYTSSFLELPKLKPRASEK